VSNKLLCTEGGKIDSQLEKQYFLEDGQRACWAKNVVCCPAAPTGAVTAKDNTKVTENHSSEELQSPDWVLSREMVKWRRYINHNKQKQLWDLTFVTGAADRNKLVTCV
jgi:predicted metal-binding transcription factor (methanogenesis marker protein 9)